MFQTLKNALGLSDSTSKRGSSGASVAVASTLAQPSGASQMSPMSEWASQQGFNYSERGSKGYSVDGVLGGKPWKLEQGKPSRDFIQGIELRARGEMGVDDDVAVMLMARSLKDELDQRAFALYTDTLQTQIDPHLPEEMRWLSMYEEVSCPELPPAFTSRYALLTDARKRAQAWLTPDLAAQLMAWPSSEPDVPLVIMVLRGKVYLRMQIQENDLPTVEHATQVFTTACMSALAVFSASKV
jgi:hypothetical protein